MAHGEYQVVRMIEIPLSWIINLIIQVLFTPALWGLLALLVSGWFYLIVIHRIYKSKRRREILVKMYDNDVICVCIFVATLCLLTSLLILNIIVIV